MLLEFATLSLSMVFCTCCLHRLVDAHAHGSGALACIPVVLVGGPLMGLIIGQAYIENGPKPHLDVNITFT